MTRQTTRAPTNTPVRNLRAADEIWEPALAKAKEEGGTLAEVLRSFLALYGTDLPDDAPTADPWEVVNLAMSQMDKVGPDTNLEAAVLSARNLLIALGIRPVRGEAGES